MTTIDREWQAAELRLQAHVQRVLASASIGTADAADLTEELYGHLWLGWQAAIAGGRAPDEAAEEAIAAFGQAEPIAHEFTATYRGRLYASTIGTLLPLVAPDGERPQAVRGLAALVGALGVFELVVGTIVALSMSPIRAVVGIVLTLLWSSLALVAARALLRGQRWALRIAQYAAMLAIASGVASLLAAARETPGRLEIPILGVAGLALLPAAVSSRTSAWFRGPRRLGRGLIVALVAIVALGTYWPPAVAAMPDPTQVGPSALDFRLSVSCERAADGRATAMALTTDATWSRVDLMPLGPFDTGSKLDEIAIWLDTSPPFVVPPADQSQPGLLGTSWILHATTIDYRPGEPARSDPEDITMTSGDASPRQWSPISVKPTAAEATLANAVPDLDLVQVIRTSALQAGHRYHGVWRGGGWGFLGPTDLYRVIAVYSHAGRFAKRAEATCDASAVGVEAPVTIP